MRTLKKRIILSFAASFLIFLFFISLIIFSGINISLRGWFKASESKYSNQIIEKLEQVFSAEQYPQFSQIRDAVSPHLNNRFSLIIFSPAGDILFVHNLPENFPSAMRMRPPEPGSGMGMMMPPEHRFRPGAAKQLLQTYPQNIFPVNYKGQPAAYVWVKTAEFAITDSDNKRFYYSIFLTLILGVIASGGVALFSTYLISGKIAREATAVSSGLELLASGSRKVVFPEKGSTEILSISRSADILQKRLIKEEQSRKQWTQDIAHDLRTPTAAIKAQLEAMIDGVFKADTARLTKLLGELRSLEVLIEDMNRLTSIESPEAKPVFSELAAQDLGDIINERFTMAAMEKKITLTIDAEKFSFQCDSNLFIRAVSNLVQNSIQYSPDNSRVNIFIRELKNNAVITVENPGEIPEEEIGKIFNRLYRGEFSRATSGTGLGLTIAEAAVRLHQGNINVENTIVDNKKYIRISASIPR